MIDDSFAMFVADLEAGKSTAQSDLVHGFTTRLIGLVRKRMNARLQEKVSAEDVVQSVFKSFFRAQDQKGFELRSWDSLWSLLAVMAVRKCNKNVDTYGAACRDIGREFKVDDGLGDAQFNSREPSVEEELHVSELIESLMRGLDERQQQALAMILEGYQTQQIAKELSCSQRTVKRWRAAIQATLLRSMEAVG